MRGAPSPTSTPAAILVVEDNPDLRQNLCMLLEHLGHTVVAAVDNGPDAIEAMREAPDLVLMDVRLRGSMDGIAAAETIRRKWDGPLIYLTGYADHETVRRAGTHEPAAFLVKPFDEAGLDAAIHIALDNHHRARARQRWTSALIDQLAGADEAMCAVDGTGRVRLVNAAAEAIFGRPRRALVGHLLADCVSDAAGGESDGETAASDAIQGWGAAMLDGLARVSHGEAAVNLSAGGHRIIIAPIGRPSHEPYGVLITARRETGDPGNPLICVCSWCRRIRDPGARWARFEEYFASSIDAQFTHSICPDCTEGLLGESNGDLGD